MYWVGIGHPQSLSTNDEQNEEEGQPDGQEENTERYIYAISEIIQPVAHQLISDWSADEHGYGQYLEVSLCLQAEELPDGGAENLSNTKFFFALLSREGCHGEQSKASYKDGYASKDAKG